MRFSRSYQTMAVTRGCSSGAVWLLTFFWEATFIHLLVVDLTPLALAKRRRRGHGCVRGRSRAGAAGCESCCLRIPSHSRATKLPSTGQECSYSLSAYELWAAAPWHAGLPSVALLHSSCKTPCRNQPYVMVGIASCTLAPPLTGMRGPFVYSRRGCSVADSGLRQPRRTSFGLLGNLWHIACTCAASKMSHRQHSRIVVGLHKCHFVASAEFRVAKVQHDLPDGELWGIAT